ncbi:MAG: serine/threonine-protein kinase [Myxococcales bacterium]
MTELGPASKIGRYQLVAPIGAGGMGRVWVALDTAAPSLRLVAVKTTLAGAVTSPEFWAMLSDEASLASRINHQNVCATYELGEEDGIHFLVMEWSDGASLRDVLDAAPNKRIPYELAAFVGANVAAGLHAAHELTDDDGHPLGVVHRDVSPQNVLVSMRGHVRLADFGVAKARGQQHKATETGEVKGKLSYMAPEQVTSKAIDRRADVFALGCVLYEACLGIRPFHGADALATMYKILEADLTPPRVVDPAFPEALEAVLLKALSKDVNARYATADDLRAALMDYLSTTRRFFADKHVAELLVGELGDGLRERNRAILATGELLRKGETDLRRLQTPRPPEPTHTLTPEGGVERSVTQALQGQAPRSRLLWVAAGALLLVGVFVSRGVWSGRDSSAPPTVVSQPAAVVVAAATASPPLTPNVTAAPSDTAVVAPEASSAKPEASVRSPAVARGRLPVRPPVVEAPAPTSKPSGKKPRPIDRDNPFETP